MNILMITSEIMNLDMLAQFAIDFGLKIDEMSTNSRSVAGRNTECSG